jgi:hypothetical protein
VSRLWRTVPRGAAVTTAAEVRRQPVFSRDCARRLRSLSRCMGSVNAANRAPVYQTLPDLSDEPITTRRRNAAGLAAEPSLAGSRLAGHPPCRNTLRGPPAIVTATRGRPARPERAPVVLCRVASIHQSGTGGPRQRARRRCWRALPLRLAPEIPEISNPPPNVSVPVRSPRESALQLCAGEGRSRSVSQFAQHARRADG